MPRGPPGIPVLGNLHQMMHARRGALSFQKWVSLNPIPKKRKKQKKKLHP